MKSGNILGGNLEIFLESLKEKYLFPNEVVEQTWASCSAVGAKTPELAPWVSSTCRERVIDNLLVRVHLIIVMIWSTGLAP